MSSSRSNTRYAPLVEILDDVPIDVKVAAYNKAVEWPGYPPKPGNPYPIVVPNMNKYIREPVPTPSPGGRVLKKNQRYAFLSNYDIFP
jgi:hypothetical protein